MNDSVERLKSRTMASLNRMAAAPATPEPQCDEEECRAFGFLRGIRERAIFLELRFSQGNFKAFPYSWLGPAEYNPSVGILLRFVGDLVYLVLIEGSNLNTPTGGIISLYTQGIQRQRITWIQEMTPSLQQRFGEHEPCIDRIRVVSHRPDEPPRNAVWLSAFADRP